MTLYDMARAKLPELIRHRRYFHQHAEAGYDLPLTLAYLKDELKAMGVAYFEPIAGALAVDLGPASPRLLLRADMDALPMEEDNDLPYRSVSAFAHTCGHDLHTAMMLEAIRLVKDQEETLPSGVRFIFQPDEEGVTGAASLLEAGILSPSIEAAFALHASPTMKADTLFYKDGALYASSDTIEIEIRGQGGHGAAPHLARDPVFAGVQIYNACQGIISRECPPHETAVFSLCSLQAGETFNVIPDSVHLSGTLRTYNPDIRAYYRDRLKMIVGHTALANQCRAELNFPTGTPPVICDTELQSQLLAGLKEDLPVELIKSQNLPFSWSEDFGLFGDHIPIVMMTLGARVQGSSASIHDPAVLFDESSMATGCAALASAALRYRSLSQ